MRIIVTGSRRWNNRLMISDRLALLPGADDTVIVHGNARGADRIADQEAKKLGLLVEVHPANWTAHGKQAGLIRNQEMADLGADLCLAFWDGSSRGCKDMMERAERAGIPVEVIR